MAEGCTATVDAELFDSLADAIAFVAACGGGVVYTDWAGTPHVEGLKLPPNVRLEASRPAAA